EDSQAINVFLDVGYRGTNVIITRGSEVSFLKQIDVGGWQFNDAVAKALAISAGEAGELRLRMMRESGGRRADEGAAVPDEVKAAVADALRPSVERLSRDLQLCLRYFAVTFRGQRPDTVTLVGGEAHEPTLTQTLTESVNTPCTIGHPLRGIGRLGAIGGRDRRTMQPAWATACGLALRGSAWVKTSARLMDRSERGPVVSAEASR
ncbi:MAG TPA: pilus assembly protein PilM, partial [Phycisphaerae bacterium]|nr:pilus assembly protein PilM [Phycisphaerae bacterium]